MELHFIWEIKFGIPFELKSQIGLDNYSQFELEIQSLNSKISSTFASFTSFGLFLFRQ